MDLGFKTAFPRGLIQVAGVRDLAEAELLLNAGVHLIGIPLRLTVNAEDLSESEAAHICRALPGKCCLITYLSDPKEIEDFVKFLQVDVVQLHGEVDPAIFPTLMASIPQVRFIKSLVIGKGPEKALMEDIQAFAPYVEAFITDTYNPANGAEGATGMVHDWKVSRTLCNLSPRPLILAGGLNPDNVGQAIQAVQPYGVDVHTGVENPDGKKSADRVKAFVREARRGFALL